MRIWLVTIGEPVPTREGRWDRPHRTGQFARFLAAHGHQVVWWTSTFDHWRKKHWFNENACLRIQDNLDIRLIRGSGYGANISLSRIWDHYYIAKQFARLIRHDSNRPDIIIAALPTVELSLESVRFGRERHIPVVLDMRDMWPDVFWQAAPKVLRPALKLAAWPYMRSSQEACAGATAITGITEAFVDWGLKRGSRSRSDADQAFPMTYAVEPPSPDKIAEAERFWDRLGVKCDDGSFRATFVGTIGRQTDWMTIVDAAQNLAQLGRPIQFVLCGTGDRFEALKRRAAGLPNVLVPGWVDAAAIYVLLRRSSVGIDPLPDRFDFLSTINNKAVEYMSAGLPVVSSPNRGVLAELLADTGSGLTYSPGDAGKLSECLQSLADNRHLTKPLSRNSAQLFEERFSAKRVLGALMAHLEAIAVNYPRVPAKQRPADVGRVLARAG